MNTVLTEDGKISIPQQVREDAQLEPGDTLDVQFYKGTLVLRKRQPLTSEQCAALLERSRSQPKPTPQDDDAVEQAIKEVWMRPRCPDQCYLTESDKRDLLQSPFFFDTSGKPIFTENALLEGEHQPTTRHAGRKAKPIRLPYFILMKSKGTLKSSC